LKNKVFEKFPLTSVDIRKLPSPLGGRGSG